MYSVSIKHSQRIFSIILFRNDEFFKIKFGGLVPECTQDVHVTAVAFPT